MAKNKCTSIGFSLRGYIHKYGVILRFSILKVVPSGFGVKLLPSIFLSSFI